MNRLDLITVPVECPELFSISTLTVIKYLIEYAHKKILMKINESKESRGRTYCYLVGPMNELTLAERDLKKKYSEAYKPFPTDRFKYDEHGINEYDCKTP